MSFHVLEICQSKEKFNFVNCFTGVCNFMRGSASSSFASWTYSTVVTTVLHFRTHIQGRNTWCADYFSVRI